MSNNQCSQSNFNRLVQYRDEILKAEIGALLFNLGKTHIGFWKGKDGEIYFQVKEDSFENVFGFKPFSGYDKYFDSAFEAEIKRYNLEDFFKAEVKFPFTVNGKDRINWIEFLKGKASEENFIKKIFFRGCENINSGIDKGNPKSQLKGKLWIANAFGTFKKEIEESDLDLRRQYFFKNLSGFLNQNNYLKHPNWQSIRNFVIEEVKNWYSKLLSDSRFPVNDVTLWDQAYMTASLFKATLAQLITENINDITDHEYFKNPSSIKWRILGIQYDKMGLAEKGFKLASIRWYRNISRKIDDAIKELIEVKYPIGNEIYRDETGIYFIVGECLGDDSKGNSIVPLKQEFKELENKILEIFKEKTDDEFYPAIYLTKASRGLMNLTTLLEKANENFLKANWEQKSLELPPRKKDRGKGIGICPVCKTRLIYEKDKENKNHPPICNTCSDRIYGQESQTKYWLKNNTEETIWIDEIKDKNDRTTYISVRFELEYWLNGNLLNSFIVRKEDWFMYLDIIENLLYNIKASSWSANIGFFANSESEIEKFLKLFDKKGIQAPFYSILKSKKYQKFLTQPEKNLKENELEYKKLFFRSIEKATNLFKKKTDDLFLELIKNIKDPKYDKSEKKFKKPKFFNDDTDTQKIVEVINSYFSIGFILMQINRLLLEPSIGNRWQTFIEDKISNPNAINFKERKIDWKLLNGEDIKFIAELLLQFLLRKNPSPARLRRVWESTQEFFENIHNNLADILEIPEWRRKRLVWRVKKTEELKQITKNEVEKDGILFWIQPGNKYIEIYLISSIDNFLKKYDKKGTIKELLNTREPDLEDVKIALETFSLSLQVSEEEKIEINANNLAKIQHYKPFSLITDISPVNYQVIIPTEYTQNLIDKVIELYNKNFKYVYGKLPLHIGIVTSHYKKPLYVSLKALRKIRRDNINPDKLWQRRNINEFCQLQKKKLKHATTEELMNQTEEYYSLYFDNPDKKDYQFYIKPDKNWKKWISTVSEFPLNSQIEMIPNTFDFEFMDTNTRRNDIFYDEENHYKRALPLKSNRPYELEIYWPKFKEFYEIFKDKNKSAKLHKLIELLYERVQNYNEAFKPLLASAFVNILELRKDNETLERIRKIFDLNTDLDILKALEEKLTEENLKLFIDMFEFWHTVLKEV